MMESGTTKAAPRPVSREEDPFATRSYDGATHGPNVQSKDASATEDGGRFAVLRPHAEGGLGKVSVALDRELNRQVALKQIKSDAADDARHRARFLREAEVTGRLEHPGIVPVYSLGRDSDGRPYYAMRFVEGESLEEAIRRFHDLERSPKDPGERELAFRALLRRFLDVCNAIAFAHRKGVLHRDIKPSNVLLGEYGETLVVDWGLAKPLGRPGTEAPPGDEPVQPSAPDDADRTLTGQALGTPGYMSPEQAEGRLDGLGPASDVYGLGATLYTILTGRVPFNHPDARMRLLDTIRGEFTAPRHVRPEVPAPLEAVCLKAMALRPEDRYRTARALGQDIERWLADEPVHAWGNTAAVRWHRWRKRHRKLVTGGALASPFIVVCLWLNVASVELNDRFYRGWQERLEQRDRDLGERERILTQREAASRRDAASGAASPQLPLPVRGQLPIEKDRGPIGSGR